MERKQKPSEFVGEKNWQEKIAESKKEFRVGQRNLSFNEKMQIALGLSERDKQIKRAKKK